MCRYFMKRKAVLLGPLLAVAIAAALLGATAREANRAHANSPSPCGTLPLSSTHYTHVLWIWLENHSYDEIIGSAEAPYINGLASGCGLASNYHNISHPSLPNYIAATSGLALTQLAHFTSDCKPARRCRTSSSSVFSQVSNWKAYEESMPKSCDRKNRGSYAVRHNPPPYYTTLANCTPNDVPYTQLGADLNAGTLPAFSFVTPNLVNDMHDGTIAQGDAWLQSNLPTILGSTAYQSGTVAVFVTWDEGEGGASNDCATNTGDVGCHVATIVVSPSTAPGTRSATLFNHYSLLAGAEQLLGVPPLGEAAAANSMMSAFNL
jgi:phosphatidylinositol-3-phosphatase